MGLLFALRAHHGSTLLLITHDAALAARCDRQIRLVDGRVAPTDASSDLEPASPTEATNGGSATGNEAGAAP